MGKYERRIKAQNQHQQAERSSAKSHFGSGMLIYMLIFFLIGAVLLGVLWDFLSVYQQSRPQTAVEAYMEGITRDKIAAQAKTLLMSTDQNLQTEQDCKEAILKCADEKITCIRKGRESTTDKLVYMLRCGTDIIGGFTMERSTGGRYGMAPWEIASEHFDFSFLLGEKQSVIVPDSYRVTINGYPLDGSYRKEGKIPYAELEEYYESYNLPGQVTYEFGPLVGDFEIEIMDAHGNPVSMDAEVDISNLLPRCTDKEKAELEKFVKKYTEVYVRFTGSNRQNVRGRHGALIQMVVRDCEFARRLGTAIEGLNFGHSVRDEVTAIDIHFITPLDGETYLCDLSYAVKTLGNKGDVMTTTNARLLVKRTSDGLKVFNMQIY